MNKWAVLSVVSIGTFISTLDGGMSSVAYPVLASAFGVETSTVVWFTVAFWVTTVGLMLTLGWIGDVAGRRRMFTAGFVLFAAGLAFTAVAADIWQVIASRVVQGVGSAMLLSNLNALITSAFPARERGKALGISGAVVGVGLSAGPLLGGLLIDVLDWRSLFYTRAPIGVVGALLSWLVLPRDTVSAGRIRADAWGAVSVFGTLACFLLVVNQGGNLGFGSPAIISLAFATGLFAAGLVWSQRRAARPILDFALFRTRLYTISLSVLFTHYLSYGAVMLAAPFLLVDAMGFSATKMGLYIGAFYFGRTLLAPLAGRASDRIGPRPFPTDGQHRAGCGIRLAQRAGESGIGVGVPGGRSAGRRGVGPVRARGHEQHHGLGPPGPAGNGLGLHCGGASAGVRHRRCDSRGDIRHSGEGVPGGAVPLWARRRPSPARMPSPEGLRTRCWQRWRLRLSRRCCPFGPGGPGPSDRRDAPGLSRGPASPWISATPAASSTRTRSHPPPSRTQARWAREGLL